MLERLQILIDADAKGAQRELEKVGRTAEKELGKVEGSLDRASKRMITFGTGMVVAGAVVAGGLFKAIEASNEAEQQTRKLSNSIQNSSNVFSKNASLLQDQAHALQQVTTADGDAIIGMDAFLVSMGLQETQILKLNPLLVDLSQKAGVDLETAAKAAVKGIDGSAKALKTLGVEIDPARAKAEGFDYVLGQIAKSAGGFAEGEGKTFNGQIAIMKNNLGDIVESVGGGAADVFGPMIGGIAGLAGAAGGANPAIGETAGKLAAVAATGSVVIGTLSFVGGQALKLRDRFTVLGDDGTRSLTNMGKAAAGIGVALGAIGAVVALKAAGDEINRVTQDVIGLNIASNELTLAQGPKAFAKALQDMAVSGEGSIDKLGDFGAKLGFGGTSDPTVEVSGLTFELDNMRKVLDNVKALDDPQLLQATITAFRGAKASGFEAQTVFNNFLPVLDQYQKELDTGGAVADKTAGSTGALGEAVEAQSEAYVAATDAVTVYKDGIKLFADAAGAATASGKAFSDSIERSSNFDNAISGAAELGANFLGFKESIADLPQTIDVTTLSLGGYNEKQTAAVKALVSAGDENSKYLAGLVEQGKGADDVRGSAELLRQKYLEQASQLGLNEEQTRQYLEVLGLTPEQVNTAIKLSEMEMAVFKITAYQSLINSTPPEQLTQFNAQLAAGDVVAAQRTLDDIARRRVATIDVNLPSPPNIGLFERLSNQDFNNNGIVGRAKGGPVTGGQPYVVGEVGPELFVPATSGRIIPNNKIGGGGSGGQLVSAGAQHVFNVTVNAGLNDPAEVGRKVVEALASFERLNGSGWRN